MRGRFITFEGIDGSGKSTQVAMLERHLREAGQSVVRTREPGGTSLGERVREILLSGGPVGALAEAHLFAAARAELVAQVIAPALERGDWVICDRFVDSSLAYQGAARGLGIDAVQDLNAAAIAPVIPDATILLALPLDAAARRRDTPEDRIESEGERLQLKVAEGYEELARRFPERIVRIAADDSVEAVHRSVLLAVAP